ncbi:MAG: hypothetical protein E7261_00050 [Lachnospiraceae bacterium]|nr:hypothetical protein [Lachnospiraceae bacterium]
MNNKLSAVRIVFGVFFSILFIPIMFAVSFAAGNIWTVDNKVLDRDAIIDEFKAMDGYDKLIDAAIETVSIDEIDKDIQKRIVSEVFDEECINEVFEQILDKIFEGEDVDINLEDEFAKGISDAIVNFYDDEAENVINAWISRDLASDYEMIYDMCGEYIDEQMISFAAGQLGVDASVLSVQNVREYLAANPISEADKKKVIDECGKLVEDYVDEYAVAIAKEINVSVEESMDEINDSEELNEASEIIMLIKENAMLAIILCGVAFAVCFIILLLIFKARRAGFVIPAVSLIFASITYFVEYIVILWVTGEMASAAEDFEDAVEILAFDFVMNFIDAIKNTILTCGAVTLAVAVILIIIGCALHTVRKDNSLKAQ